MPKYLLLKHYAGGPEHHPNFVPMSEWTEDEITAHMAFQRHEPVVRVVGVHGRPQWYGRAVGLRCEAVHDGTYDGEPLTPGRPARARRYRSPNVIDEYLG